MIHTDPICGFDVLVKDNACERSMNDERWSHASPRPPGACWTMTSHHLQAEPFASGDGTRFRVSEDGDFLVARLSGHKLAFAMGLEVGDSLLMTPSAARWL